MPSKEEYLKKHNVSEKKFLIYCVNALNDNFMLNDDDNINDLKGFLYDLICEHFKGIKNLNEVIEVQKNNLTDNYMIGLYNGLVTAKNILLDKHINNELVDCVENIKSYKFEDLKPNMWVYDGIEKLICQIGLISKNAIHREYADGTISDSPFEENRFFPVQCANYLGGI